MKKQRLNPDICKHDLLISILSIDIAHNPLQRKEKRTQITKTKKSFFSTIYPQLEEMKGVVCFF